MMRRPALLAILDGVGLADAGPGNAVSQADAPFLHELISDSTWPCRSLEASGRAVGLPVGQMGNSEVGHLNIGAGRIVNQELTHIDIAIEDGSFFTNPVLCVAFDAARQRGGRLHLVGLLSDGGVHSMDSHLQALAEMAASRGLSEIALHALLDGRDVAPDSGIAYVRETESFLAGLIAKHEGLDAYIASLGGRYFGMDRDHRWERVERFWQAMVMPAAIMPAGLPAGKGNPDSAPGRASDLVLASYAAGVLDEFLEPVALDLRGVADGDLIVFFNFRPDRARELSQAFIDPGFDGFARPVLPKVDFICMTEYDPRFAAFGAQVAFEKQLPENVLADHLSSLGLRQLHIAETEKYAHVTFFLNGGVEEPKPGEQRVLIDSPKVATYDLQPQMSAPEVTDALVAAIQADQADVFIVNYANGDMVGHTGIQTAAEQAVAEVDRCLRQVIEAILAAGGVAVITADHGNADQMLDSQGNVWTAHSLSPVPFAIICAESRGSGRSIDLDREGAASLADIAPTLLDLMGLPIPAEFTGRSLLQRVGTGS
ncbi:MAG: 2,3-bisphosphoglycerate-independent phosphoglycerate mutase, partial [Coriobacteriia bacterium]|nr:2,3-bisphosphoglycerate-independent phosphoglycerate mutase [Coriobacteriia bacterium]